MTRDQARVVSRNQMKSYPTDRTLPGPLVYVSLNQLSTPVQSAIARAEEWQSIVTFT